ncbi:muconolactone delta-isomerase [Rhodococcus gordoniae]|uniref:Muconolactone Delta-isomerase n=2 Tax=Rhodococcus TaxID=1827 RepID=A0A379M0G2_9NOCA|nr:MULTISPECIES: muconolactone Delta-isomerase [Rhodococcus]MBS9374834.1 Muconolactone Delta-isomerase [Rhodococcus sp. B50]UTT48416.1 muconolactone Delta-isomerase [Rhodococcus gordoniae]BAE46389.1 muconolactone isomerase [Rhodococcus sp. AN-22]SUE15814.1 muconolactone delta-isomerase [Rhodococcus gordoniae]
MALFHVRMDVDIPRDLDPDVRAETVAKEKAYSQDLQRQGKWREIWRIVGQYSNISIFDVESADELHEILWNLPLFPYMNIEIMPLTKHGSDIK